MIDTRHLISIVIPAYNRADTLFEALQSCFAQAYRPLEIVIGDDSTTDAVGAMVAAVAVPEGVTIRYQRHDRSKGQSGNVTWLFAAASGKRLVLLHDDDLLLPGGLDTLERTWDRFPSAGCVFGKQVVIAQDGAPDLHQTLSINAMYFRADRPTGPLKPTESVGLLQQVPNNGYLIDTRLARAISYRDESEVGYASDADFGIRLSLAMEDRDFVYIDDYVSAYRIMVGSMMRTTHRNQEHHLIYRFVEGLRLPAAAEPARVLFLDRHGPAAVLDAANAGDQALARRILTSGHYGRSVAGIHGLLVRISIASPRVGARLRPYFKSGVQAARRVVGSLRKQHAPSREPEGASPRERAAVEALVPAMTRTNAERHAGYRALLGERTAA